MEETTEPIYLATIDLSSSINDISEIEDFDVEGGYIYFIYSKSMYRIDLSSDLRTIEHIIEDVIDWPSSLKVIDHTLYYQGDWVWSASTAIKQVDLKNVSAGIQSTHAVMGISRSQLCKNIAKLYYLSSPDGF